MTSSILTITNLDIMEKTILNLTNKSALYNITNTISKTIIITKDSVSAWNSHSNYNNICSHYEKPIK